MRDTKDPSSDSLTVSGVCDALIREAVRRYSTRRYDSTVQYSTLRYYDAASGYVGDLLASCKPRDSRERKQKWDVSAPKSKQTPRHGFAWITRNHGIIITTPPETNPSFPPCNLNHPTMPSFFPWKPPSTISQP
jgi:hypothetical protein